MKEFVPLAKLKGDDNWVLILYKVRISDGLSVFSFRLLGVWVRVRGGREDGRTRGSSPTQYG